MEDVPMSEGTTIIGSERSMNDPSRPGKAPNSSASDDLMPPMCEVCHWRPDTSVTRSLEDFRQAVRKHLKRNHQSLEYRCAICDQSFGNRHDNVKPHIQRKHPGVFKLLYPAEASSLNHFVLGPKEQAFLFERLTGLSNAPAFQESSGTAPEALAEQSRRSFSPQGLSTSSAFYWGRGTTQGSDDSGYSSVGNRDNITTSTEAYIHSRPWQRGYYEQSFYTVPGGFGVGADECRTSRASSAETSCQDGQTDVEVRSTELGFHKNDAGSERVAVSFPPCQALSTPKNEDSNDGLSSRPTETSTPESSCFWLSEYSEDEEVRLEEPHPFMNFKASALAKVFEGFLSWKEVLSDQDVPCDGESKGNGGPNQDKGKARDSANGKRKWADTSETSKGVTDESEPSSTQTTSSKRRRTSERKLTFACPYTKKDPTSYRDCYRYTLSRIRDVKQHLYRCHRNPPYCPRCRDTFRTEEERDEHIREYSCPLRPSTRFEGTTESQQQQLAKKSASNSSVEDQWFVVFDILFPGHDPRPQSPYIDRELLQDITLYQDFLTSSGPRILSDVLTQRGAITWNLPNEERDLAAFQQTIFEEGLRAIFDQWVARRSSIRGDPIISSNTGVASELTPPSSATSGERVDLNSNQAPGEPSPGITSTDLGREPPNTLAGNEGVQEAVTDQNLFTENLNEFLDFGQEGVDFHQGIPYEGPDEELMRLMMGSQASSTFQPAPG